MIKNAGKGIDIEAGTSCTSIISNNLIDNAAEQCIRLQNDGEFSMAPIITNNTLTHSSDGIYITGYDPSPVITDNIVVSNDYTGIFINGGYFTAGSSKDAAINYNCVWNNSQNYVGCTAGDDDISEDPLFATGPGGEYYLGQTAAGQSVDSPCVDAGSDLASNLEVLGFSMNDLNTRTDLADDSGTVDMGFHYNDQPLTPVPTPIPTDIPTQVATGIPTQAPSEIPSEIPTETATQVPTEIPTGIPTQPATHTPQFTATPTAQPSPAPIPALDTAGLLSLLIILTFGLTCVTRKKSSLI